MDQFQIREIGSFVRLCIGTSLGLGFGSRVWELRLVSDRVGTSLTGTGTGV